MTITASGTAADTHQADRIARLFAEGHGIDFVCERGVQAGWTRARVLQVVCERGWTLDGSGRLPRADRPAVIPGRPVPRQAARMPAAGTIGGPPPAAVPAPRPSPGRAQLDALLGTQAPRRGGDRSGSGRRPSTRDSGGAERPAPDHRCRDGTGHRISNAGSRSWDRGARRPAAGKPAPNPHRR